MADASGAELNLANGTWVLSDQGVTGQQSEAFHCRLRHQNPVEWVFVQGLQTLVLPTAFHTSSCDLFARPPTFAKAARSEFFLYDLSKLKLPVGCVYDPVELGVMIAQEVEARALRDVVPVVIQDIQGVAVSEVLEDHEVVGELRAEV
jgi:hypothetical protein